MGSRGVGGLFMSWMGMEYREEVRGLGGIGQKYVGISKASKGVITRYI